WPEPPSPSALHAARLCICMLLNASRYDVGLPSAPVATSAARTPAVTTLRYTYGALGTRVAVRVASSERVGGCDAVSLRVRPLRVKVRAVRDGVRVRDTLAG